MAPSRCCTSALKLPLLSCAAALCALSLQGCGIAVPRHAIGNWEAKPSYLSEFEFVPPAIKEKSGKVTPATPILNSCSDPSVPTALQCNGHGSCRDWNDLVPGKSPAAKRLAFCECDLDWADPECRTPRKSQMTAFLLSIFFGMFGADQFYLGHVTYGVLKLITLGGFGAWYLFDLCRIGSAPVLTHYNFRVAADLPHFAFVLTVVALMLFFGFALSIRSIMQERNKKAHELLLLRLQVDEEEAEEEDKPLPATMPLRSANFSGYGSVLPGPSPPSAVPAEMSQSITTPPPMTMPPTTMPPTTMPPTMMPASIPGSSSVLPAVRNMPMAQSPAQIE